MSTSLPSLQCGTVVIWEGEWVREEGSVSIQFKNFNHPTRCNFVVVMAGQGQTKPSALARDGGGGWGGVMGGSYRPARISTCLCNPLQELTSAHSTCLCNIM